jgi:hypothetical protein
MVDLSRVEISRVNLSFKSSLRLFLTCSQCAPEISSSGRSDNGAAAAGAGGALRARRWCAPAPERIRTSDPQIRSLLLRPIRPGLYELKVVSLTIGLSCLQLAPHFFMVLRCPLLVDPDITIGPHR